MTEPEIDTAIDRAVRDLMNVDADAAFRARVAERLERPAARRTRPWLLAVPAAAVILVIALAWMRSSPDVPVGPAPVARVEAPAGTAPLPQTRPGLPPSNVTPTLAPPARPASPRAATASIARGAIVATVAEAPMTGIAPPLSALDSIEVEPIGPTPVATTEIVVAPLSPITEVQVSPLEPRAARD